MGKSKTVNRSGWQANHRAHGDGPIRSDAQHWLEAEEYYDRVARKAYELFEQRGREHGLDVADWLEAERSVEEELRQGLGQDRP
jgi:hypothetical protein